MTVRWNAGDPKGIPSGYNGPDIPDDVSVPSCGIGDVDEALFRVFDSEIGFQVTSVRGDKKQTHKVPVFFGVGEKWAAVKKNILLRDKQGTLILPLISIRRVSIDQHPDQDQHGRGINQATGELVFRRRLGPKDRAYQNLINKVALQNQQNVPESETSEPQGTLRSIGANARDADVVAGGLLNSRLGKNVWEFLTIPAPQFYTANYEVTIWTQYVTHMNQLIQRLMAAFLPQLPSLKLTTKKGYWFVGYVNGDFKSEDNFDDLTEQERLIKYVFTLKVPAYTVAPDDSGLQSPIRRFVSAPEVSFQLLVDDPQLFTSSGNQVENKAADGADDPTLGYSLQGEVVPRPAKDRAIFTAKVVKNPFTGKDSTKFVKVVSTNLKNGEAVFHPVNAGIEIELE